MLAIFDAFSTSGRTSSPRALGYLSPADQSISAMKNKQGLVRAAPSRIFEPSMFIQQPSQLWRPSDVAAFCACCGAEITLKAGVCPLCGAPQHGMSPQPDLLPTLDIEADYRETSEAL